MLSDPVLGLGPGPLAQLGLRSCLPGSALPWVPCQGPPALLGGGNVQQHVSVVPQGLAPVGQRKLPVGGVVGGPGGREEGLQQGAWLSEQSDIPAAAASLEAGLQHAKDGGKVVAPQANVQHSLAGGGAVQVVGVQDEHLGGIHGSQEVSHQGGGGGQQSEVQGHRGQVVEAGVLAWHQGGGKALLIGSAPGAVGTPIQVAPTHTLHSWRDQVSPVPQEGGALPKHHAVAVLQKALARVGPSELKAVVLKEVVKGGRGASSAQAAGLRRHPLVRPTLQAKQVIVQLSVGCC